MKIEIMLKQHCIKTGVKRRYSKLLNRYFNNVISDQEKVEIETKIEALKFFLENADFDQLRFVYPELSGFDELTIMLKIPENHHEITIAYKDRIINPEWRMSHE